MFNRFLNMFPRGDTLVITTDGSGAIALASSTSGISGVAFTTDGTNGQVTVTLRSARVAGYAVGGGAASATAALVVAQLGTSTTTAFVVVVSDMATPDPVDLAATAVRINLLVA